MGNAHVPRVARIAATIEFRRPLHHGDARTASRGGNRRAQTGIAAAGDDHIIMRSELSHRP
jgi:hypothetical protein